MKTLISTITNTYKAVRLLSNPDVEAYLQKQLKDTKSTTRSDSEAFGTKNAFYHKHYIVQVLN